MAKYWLYKVGEFDRGEPIELTATQYDHIRNGYGDYRVKVDDWPAFIAEIRKLSGLRYIDIGAECDCSEATISDLVTGRSKEPRDALGVRLRALHARVLRDVDSAIAKIDASISNETGESQVRIAANG